MTTQDTDLRSVLERLTRVEAQNRRLRRAGIVAGIAVGLALLVGQARPRSRTGADKAVEAQAFVLRDGQGRERAWLGVWEDSPRLMMYDKQRNLRLGLRVGEDGAPAVILSGPGMKTRAWLRLHADGAVSLALRDRQGQTRAALGVEKNGVAKLKLFDANGREQFAAP